MTRRANPQAGFTLIEVLIGITLLAMLGTLIASGTRLGGRAWNSAERQTADSDDMVLLQSLFRRTIVRARPAFVSADPRDMTVAFAGEPDTLSLVAPQPGTQYGGPWVQERFYVARHGASRALFVDLRVNATSAPDNRTVGENQAVLLDHVSKIEFAYFGPSGPGAPPAWQETWTNRSRLPDLVRVAIVRDSPGLPPWPELIVGTRVTANAGCIYDAFGTDCRRVR
jgi:general secretion pathway protein J